MPEQFRSDFLVDFVVFDEQNARASEVRKSAIRRLRTGFGFAFGIAMTGSSQKTEFKVR